MWFFFSLTEIENPEIGQYRRVTLMLWTGLGQTFHSCCSWNINQINSTALQLDLGPPQLKSEP